MSYAPIIFLTLAALMAIANLCSFIENQIRRRKGIKLKYTPVPYVSFICGCLAWIKGRGMIGGWAFLPVVLDPGTWVIIPLAWNYWASRKAPQNQQRKNPDGKLRG